MNELDSQARELVGRALEGEGPTAAERSRVRGAVFARVGVGVAIVSALPGTAAATTAAAGSAVAMGFATKLMAVIVLAGAVGAGGYVAVSGHKSAPRVSNPLTLTLSQKEEVKSPAVDRHASPAAGKGAAGEETTRPETATPTPTATPTATPTPTLTATPTISVGAASSLAEETRALKSVITDLRDGQLDRALAGIDAQDVRFQGGALAEERAEARITALCALGRNDEARADASRFLRAHPRSLLAGRVRASCGGDGSEVTR